MERLQIDETEPAIAILDEERLKALGILALGVAHDLRNLLTIISIAIEAPRSAGDSGSEVVRQAVLSAAQRGRELVAELSRYAYNEAPSLCSIDLNRLARQNALLSGVIVPRNITLDLQLDPDLRPIPGDEGGLCLAILNLVLNAAEAMPEGGTITIRTRNLRRSGVLLGVLDTGRGMHPRDAARVGEPFRTTKAAKVGNGLGLARVRAAVERMNGKMCIFSQPGRGTRIYLMLPS